MGGGLVRCVECAEVQWNLRAGANVPKTQHCRVCGADVRTERRRPGRRLVPAPAGERRDARASPAV